jgi:hypothetical protein
MPAYSAYEFVVVVRAPMMVPDRGDLVLRGLAVTRSVAHILLTVPREQYLASNGVPDGAHDFGRVAVR